METTAKAMTSADIEQGLARLAAALPGDRVRVACLFGSVLEGPARDVDIGLLLRDYSFEQYLEAVEMAQRALHTAAVDVIPLNRANAALKLKALLDGRLLFADDEATVQEAIAEALFEYGDFQHFVAEYRRRFEARCEEGLSMAERKVDRVRVETHLSALDDAVAQLRRLGGRFRSFEEFRADLDTRELCVHYLRIALESVLDICRHFLAVVGVSLAEVETLNLIELAAGRGLLDRSFARKIRGMAGMRNAIVHVYWRLDYEAIHRAITRDLSDFDEFARQVRSYLEGK